MERRGPIIGMNTGLEHDAEGGMTALRPAYWESVAQAGGVPVLMPQLRDPFAIDAFLDRVDAFVMVGGDDLSPARTGQPAPPTAVLLDPRREDSDFLLLERLLARRMPTLAICLACQELNVIHGGTLYQDLPLDGPPVLIRHYARFVGVAATHSITVEPQSTLARLWDCAHEAIVNSSHHQAIRALGSGLRRAAWAPDEITEAIEVVDHPFFLGVQWHPERLTHADPQQRKLFAHLVQSGLK